MGDGKCSADVPNISNLVHIARRARYGSLPDQPQTLQFDLDEDHVPPGFLRRDIKVDNQHHLIFATDSQLELLARAKRWYLDGTFLVVRKPFYQLFSIHAFIRYQDNIKQVPLCFALMSGKRAQDYEAVFTAIDELLPHPAVIEGALTDYEKAIWKGIQAVYPNISVVGCSFHYTQAVYRKVQEKKLVIRYSQDDGTHRFIRKLLALCYLPVEHIAPMLSLMRDSADPADANLLELMDYMESYWGENGTFPPLKWSVFRQDVKTNNDSEGFHNHLRVVANANELLYVLMKILRSEANLVPIQAQLLSHGHVLRRQRVTYKTLQKRLLNYWEEFEQELKSPEQLLRACSHLVHVPLK